MTMRAFQAEPNPGVQIIGRGGDGDGFGTPHAGGPLFISGARLGLWIFIGVASILFSALVSAYIVRMGLPDWRVMPDPAILWVNTFVLVLSSAALQWASSAARRNNLETTQRSLLIGGGLAFLFMLGQLWAWKELNELGYFVASNPANTFFYLITALHALHLAGGLIAWWRTRSGIRLGLATRARQSVSLCAVYWHFLLIVWLALFGMMLLT